MQMKESQKKNNISSKLEERNQSFKKRKKFMKLSAFYFEDN